MVMIRPAQEQDILSLLDLYDALYALLINEYGYPFSFHREENEKMLAVQIKSRFCCLYVAEAEEQLIGFVHGSVSKLERRLTYGDQKIIGRIDDIYVNGEYQGMGVAALLLQAAEDWFSEEGISLVESYILCANPRSLRFHENHGYGAAAYRTLKKL